MTHNPLTVQVVTPIEMAAALMLDIQVACFPVISFTCCVKGISGWKDTL